MKTIRDAQALLGMAETGQLNEDMSAAIHTVTEKLYDLSTERPNITYKGSVTLVLNFEAKNGMVEVNADIPPVKLPKLPRKSSVYFLIEGGELSTEHPQQHDMFGGPREIDHTRSR